MDTITFPALELRVGDVSERTIAGVVVPWDETSFLTPDRNGERFVAGALTRSVTQKGSRIKLFSNHQHDRAVGRAVSWEPDHSGGCWGVFRVRTGADADALLDDIREGLLDGFSVGFRPVRERRGRDGAREVLEAELHEVSVVPIAAYDGARILAQRAARPRFEIPPVPIVNLDPVPLVAATPVRYLT